MGECLQGEADLSDQPDVVLALGPIPEGVVFLDPALGLQEHGGGMHYSRTCTNIIDSLNSPLLPSITRGPAQQCGIMHQQAKLHAERPSLLNSSHALT